MEHRRPRKRARRSNKTKADSVPQAAHIFSLPFELIAEILVYTASPKDVLAVARCSKSLCNTLLREESAFIWRSVRTHCLPGPLPDPQAIHLPEPAFAALVFDGGKCIACGAQTLNMYASWSLRVRFCSRAECRDSWTRNHIEMRTNFDILNRLQLKALAWIPLAESSACFLAHGNPLQTWPEANKMYLKSTMDAALVEYETENSNIVDKRHALDVTRSPLRMSFYVALHNWKHRRQVLERHVKEHNENFGKALALKEGYVYTELVSGSGTYQALHGHRTRNLEFISRVDYEVSAARIEAEMVSAQERQVRRADEATIKTSREQVEQHYNRLVSQSRSKVPPVPLPSLSEFRAMPILDLLQSPSTSTLTMPGGRPKKGSKVAHSLKSETLVNDLLNTELARWRKGAETALGASLGFPAWKTARNNKLHPVARLTARWNCTKCGKVGRAYKWDECLDYAGVCRHECTKAKQKESWTPQQFVKDDTAVNAMTKLLKLCDIDAEDTGSFAALDSIGPRIRCLSCSAAIVMRPSNVVGHSQRHEAMDMALLTQPDADALVVSPIEKSLGMRLMGHDDYKVKTVQKTWVYGCRHCDQRVIPVAEKAPEQPVGPIAENPAPAAGGADDKMGDEQPEGKIEAIKKPKNQTKLPKRYAFNGLRSHLKEKHSILLPHDEDFYHCITDGVSAIKAVA
ncbi:hypothetical protein C8R47DRAFT_1144696 [Mycena vitilis]|nr:hypothetical protein C8R47DRAFT_1144696 [Mycena vitilis]